MSNEKLIARIERDAGVPGLASVLAERLSPTDLQSLLIEVYRRRAGDVSAARLMDQYEQNRFVRPSAVDPRVMAELVRRAWSILPAGYEPIDLSPVCPLGTSAAVATCDQNKILTTSRNTEVVSDSTNVMALEAASRRRRDPSTAVFLASAHRLLRTPTFQGPRSFAHFGVLALGAAGRDVGGFGFQLAAMVDQLSFYLALLEHSAYRHPRIAITVLTAGFPVMDLMEAMKRRAEVHLDPGRTSGRGYYRDVMFKLFARTEDGEEVELGDGGSTDWTQQLLANRKERYVIAGLGLDRLGL